MFADFEASGIYKGWHPPNPEPMFSDEAPVSLAKGRLRSQPKSVLVFLPGLNEIETFVRQF